MNNRQKRFCDEYLIDCNAVQAALRADYSKATAKNASCWINENNRAKDGFIFRPEMKEYIDRQLEKLHNERTADAREVLEYLTSVLRGESCSSVLSMCGDGRQKVVKKPPDEKERLRAAELIGKRYSLFKEGLDISAALPVVIFGGDLLED